MDTDRYIVEGMHSLEGKRGYTVQKMQLSPSWQPPCFAEIVR